MDKNEKKYIRRAPVTNGNFGVSLWKWKITTNMTKKIIAGRTKIALRIKKTNTLFVPR
jgi:hypothetical protein